ncbi:MAG: hypothetical protein M3022_16150 [Actinomycetota bacterium]|nr:hypothetical protein [Actinomycetota bacterium]
MELSRLGEARTALCRARPSLAAPRALFALAALILVLLGLPGAGQARAATPPPATAYAPLVTAAPSGSPTLVTNMARAPAGDTLIPSRVLAIANADPRVRAVRRQYPHAIPYVYTHDNRAWQVSWFSKGKPQREQIQVYVDDHVRRVTQVWTGWQVAWGMARGYPGAFGRHVNAVYLWLPLCLLFLAPFVPWRRGRRRLGLLHLDLLMLLGFSISLAFFNHADVGMSVPLVYPFLVYFLVRMLLLAFGRGVPRRPLELALPTSWLLCGAVFLIGMRVGLNILGSNVIDVGYAGVIGSDKLIHGHLLYGLWPHDNQYGDTYGPVTYFAYVPFRLIFGWSGSWDALPAAHAAAIAFDLLTAGGLYVLGRRIRGHALGVVLLYAWVSYPFTLYALSANTNDSLVAATLVLALLAITSAPARGVAAAVAGLTKFAPLALAPLLLRGTGERPRERSAVVFIAAFGIAAFVAMLPVLLNGDLHYLWKDSIAYQSSRVTPFSVWGFYGGLGPLQHFLQGMTAGAAILFAFVPRRRGVVEVAALGAVLLIALQIIGNYWLYPYVVWFFPLVAVALFAGHPERPLERRPEVFAAPRRVAEPVALA